ncbi:MAG TPA: hypothetical protein VJK03_01970 [Candidatus Nanoarchaeia archaeon]|nr:hypothetical protein [Candidatus Nanoarchaeia archaeon]
MKHLVSNLPKGLDSEHYIYVPQHKMGVRDYQILKGLNYQDTQDALARDCLNLTPIKVFIDHLINVRDAVIPRPKDRVPLHFVTGEKVGRRKASALWDYLSNDGNGAVWTHLNGKFRDINGDLHIITSHRLSRDVLLQMSQPVIYSLMNEGFVPLFHSAFNSQGLPIKSAEKQDYVHGETINFFPPSNGHVAGFITNSHGAALYCHGSPAVPGIPRGVIPCAGGE